MLIANLVFFGIIAFLLFKAVTYFAPKFMAVNLDKYKKSTDGTWAIVTGASEGIGAAWVSSLAKKGFNIILLARSTQKLQDLAKEVEEKYNVKTQVHSVDFSKGSDEKFWDDLLESFGDIDIGILVNNVGCVNYLPSFIDDVNFDEITRMIDLNVRTTTAITQKVAKKMLARKHLSAIINLSSFTSLVPSPMLQVYGATKAYVKHFSRSIAAEYKGSIDVLALAPWYVCTNMTMIRKPTLTSITPEKFVESSLPYLGRTDVVDPYLVHWILEHLFYFFYCCFYKHNIGSTDFDLFPGGCVSLSFGERVCSLMDSSLFSICVRMIPLSIYFPQMIKVQKVVRSKLIKKLERAKKD